MHDIEFADSVVPAPVVILKLRLLPYSLGHEALLLGQRNAFLLNSADQFSALPLEQQIFSLKMAVLVCSQTWEQNHKPHKWLRVWGWATKKCDYALAVVEFRNYLTAGRALPSAPTKFACEVLYGKEDEKGRVLGSPLLAQIYNWTADNRLKMSKRADFESWDAPYRLAGMLYFAELEMEGRARIENQLEREEQAAYEKIEDETAADEAKNPAGAPASGVGLASEPPDLN